jgi:hypothetical protein
MISASCRLRLMPETYYVSVSIFDRYLALKKVAKFRLKLLACACIMVASKYEDIYPPELRDITRLLDSKCPSYTRHEVIDMESSILEVLSFDFTAPTPLFFLERFGKLTNMEEKASFIAQYLLCISSCDSNMITMSSSQLAAGAFWIAQKTLRGIVTWDSSLLRASGGLSEQDAKEVAMKMKNSLDVVLEDLKLVNARKKFANMKYYEVSKLEDLVFPA